MSEELEKLKEIGIAKVCEETHVSKKYIQALMDEDFKFLTKVQFLGFVSIVERDYQLDLSALKAKGREFYLQMEVPTVADVFIESRPRRSYKGIYILIAVILFAGVAYWSIDSQSTTTDTQASEMQSVTEEIEALVEENAVDMQLEKDDNLSEISQDGNEINPNIQKELNEASKGVETKTETLKFVVNKKTWLGYIELATQNKNQKYFFENFEIDANKDWLLRFGHRDVKIELDGQIETLDPKFGMQFLYQDGILTQISMSQFKKLNEGKEW